MIEDTIMIRPGWRRDQNRLWRPEMFEEFPADAEGAGSWEGLDDCDAIVFDCWTWLAEDKGRDEFAVLWETGDGRVFFELAIMSIDVGYLYRIFLRGLLLLLFGLNWGRRVFPYRLGKHLLQDWFSKSKLSIFNERDCYSWIRISFEILR